MAGICEFCGKKIGFTDAEFFIPFEKNRYRVCYSCNTAKTSFEAKCRQLGDEEIQKEKNLFCSKCSKCKDIGKLADEIIQNSVKIREETQRTRVMQKENTERMQAERQKANEMLRNNRQKILGSLAAYREQRYDNLIYRVDGCRGRSIEVYSNKVVIRTDVTIGSVLTGNVTDGMKTIYYADCIGLQFREPSAILIGYLQLETAAATMNNDKSNFFNENTFTYEVVTDEIREIHDYIQMRLDEIKK